MPSVLLIDDKRNAKDVRMEVERICRDYYEGVKALAEKKWDHLLLDHELSDDSGYPTGLQVMEWLEEHPEHLPGKITSVSMSMWAREEVAKRCKVLYGQ